MVGAAVAGAVAILYVATAARDIVFGDSPELTGAAITLGVAHPPGYPVWTVLAHVFTLLPLGPLPLRVSLFSVAASLVCLGFVYATAYRLGRSAWAAAAAALALALAPVYWSWSIVPEVFALNAAIAAAMVHLLLRWHESGRPRDFIAAAALGGVGMANHQTIGLIAPAVLLLMWRHASRFRDGGPLPSAVVAFGLGLLPYAYLPMAAAARPPWNWGEISSLGEVLGHVLRVGYGSTQLVTEQAFGGGAATDRLLELARSFTVVEAVLVGAGAVRLYRADRVWLAFVALAVALAGPAFVVYANINVSAFDLTRAVLERFFLLGHVLVAPLAALGVLAAADALARVVRAGPGWRERGTAAAAALAAIAVAAASFGDVDQSRSGTARAFAEDILATARPDAVLLLSGDALVFPVEYLMRVEGRRPDVRLVQVPLLRGEWYLRQLRRHYPDLVVPSDPVPPAQIRGLIQPNGPQRFDIVATLPDGSMGTTYGLYRRGLVQELRPGREEIDVAAFAALNDALLRSYRIPSVPPESRRRWERLVQGDYAVVAHDVGRVYELAGDPANAREWYARALAISPDLTAARDALRRLSR